MNADPDQAYRVAAAFFAELSAHGVADVVISPGSRSTPLAITADACAALTTHVMLDERAAGFFALGLARAADRPVTLICTSGTAAANYLPAVIEAHYSRVPLIVCTADRPPELRDRGAGQTVDQVGIYGTHLRWFVDLPVATDVDTAFACRLAARVIVESGGSHPGPVHCNWPLREPLAPVAWSPDRSSRRDPTVVIDRSTAALDREVAADLAALTSIERGLIVVGPGDLGASGDDIGRVSEATGWPVLAEATSSVRTGRHVTDRPFVNHWDLLVRNDGWADGHVPDLVVRLGRSPTSKALRLWLERHRPPLVIVDPAARLDDPSDLVSRVVAVDEPVALAALASEQGPGVTPWTETWLTADHALATMVDDLLAQGPLLEAGIVRVLAGSLGADGALVASNSMPVRDVDGFLAVSPDPRRVIANRGASGIDGVTSTAFGVAATGRSTVLLTGDVALMHDIGGLHAGLRAGLDLTIVVPDNGGGGIFEFLPIADHPDIDFEGLFLTPSRVDWTGLAALDGLRFHTATTASELRATLADAVARAGVDLVRVPVDRQANVAQHLALTALVGELDR